MLLRCTAVAVSVLFFCGCGDGPSPLSLNVTVSPNPLPAPNAAGDIFWDVEFRNSGREALLLERAEARLVDASGARVGESNQFYSRSAGCSVCTTDFTIASGISHRFSGNRAHHATGRAPATFVLTVYYSGDSGPNSTTVEVPVQ